LDNHMKLQAAIDQMGAALRDIAPAMASYFNSLLKQGFKRNEALALTVEMQNTIMKADMNQK